MKVLVSDYDIDDEEWFLDHEFDWTDDMAERLKVWYGRDTEFDFMEHHYDEVAGLATLDLAAALDAIYSQL